MKNATRFRLVLVTAPDLKTARALAAKALAARLIACANIIRGIESHYLWKGKTERGSEVLMLLKTTSKRLAGLERLILSRHPYDTAEFLVLKTDAGAERYLRWLAQSCAD